MAAPTITSLSSIEAKQSRDTKTHCQENRRAENGDNGRFTQGGPQCLGLHVQSQQKQQENNADMANVRQQAEVGDQ